MKVSAENWLNRKFHRNEFGLGCADMWSRLPSESVFETIMINY